MKNYAIALGFKGKLYNDINKALKIFKKDMNIKFMATNHASSHITILSGKTENIDKIYKKIKKLKLKKFKLKSPGMGIFANQDPNLYLRWEQSLDLAKISNIIRKQSSKLFHEVKQAPNNPMWVPKTTLAWKDLKYTDLSVIFKKTNFIFKKHEAVISFIYFLAYNHDEIITHKIKLN